VRAHYLGEKERIMKKSRAIRIEFVMEQWPRRRLVRGGEQDERSGCA
jgi:hypothetical protein